MKPENKIKKVNASKLYCEKCIDCVQDCKKLYLEDENCEHYQKGVSRFEYLEMIKHQNVNLRRFCKQNGLKLYCLLNMLKGKQMFKYKYKMKLNERLFEKACYLPYLDRFEKEGEED